VRIQCCFDFASLDFAHSFDLSATLVTLSKQHLHKNTIMNFEVIVNSVQESPVHNEERVVILADLGSSTDAPTDLKAGLAAGADGTDKPGIVKNPAAMVEKDSIFATETNCCVDKLLIEEAANATPDTETVDDDGAERSTKTLSEETRPTKGSAVSPEQSPVAPTVPTNAASEKVRDVEEANQAFQTPKRKKLAIPAAFQTGTSKISLTPVKKATVVRLWGTVDESNRFESATTPRVSNKSSRGPATSPVSPNKTAKRSNKSKARMAQLKLKIEIAELDLQIAEAKKQHTVKEEAIPIVEQEVEENEQAAPQDDHDDDMNHSFGQVSEQVENEGAVVIETKASKENETADVLEIESIAGSSSSHYEDALGGFVESSIDVSCSSRYEDALDGVLEQRQHSFNNDRSALNDDPSDKRSDDAVDMTGQVEGSKSLGDAVELSKCRTTDYDTICHVLCSKGCVTDEDDDIELKDPSASSDNASSAATGETEATTHDFSVEESTKDKPTAAEQLDDVEEEMSGKRKKIVVVRQKLQRRKSFGDKLRNSFRLKKKKQATSADAEATQEQEDCEPPASGAQPIKAEELPKDIQDALANGEKKIIVVRKVKRRKSLGEKLRRSFRLKKKEKVEALSADPDQYVYVNMRGNYQRVLFDCGNGP